MKANESWFSRGKVEAEKGIPFSERVVGIAIVVFSVLMVLGIIVYLGAAVYCPIAYGFVGKKRAKREETPAR